MKKLAIVLSGGGARGALQVGALRALLEAGIHPDLFVGTSIGAVNAAFLAVNGFSSEGIDRLESAWQEAARIDLLPANYLWLTLRSLFDRPKSATARRIVDFFVTHGLSLDLRFADLQQISLIVVSGDLQSGCPVLHGLNLEERLLDGVVASTAIPPWVTPIENDGQLLMDGGIVSNLPIQPALTAGATEIIALDLLDPRDLNSTRMGGFAPLLNKMIYTIEKRHRDLEEQLAQALGVRIMTMNLHGKEPIPLWDFSRAVPLISWGYELARQEIAHWYLPEIPIWLEWLEMLD